MRRYCQLIIAGLVMCHCLSAMAHSHHHSRIGSHGMALITDGHSLFATHLPLYSTPHDYQMLIELKSDRSRELIEFILTTQPKADTIINAPALTLLPDVFDLNRLVAAESFSINATVYKGHFERGGEAWIDNIDVVFASVVYMRQINSVKDNPNHHQWDIVKRKNSDNALIVHRIEHRPSFDAIAVGEDCNSDSIVVDDITHSVASIDESTQWAFPCKSHHIVYIETLDFSN